MVVTVFRSRLNPQAEDEYAQWAERIAELARGMPGYISHKGFTAADGERVTLVEFESEEHVRAWSVHPDHVQAKKKGRAAFYLEYRIQVCKVLKQSDFSAS
jgi:heme-degrading monooxygenase HmoA